MSIEFYYFSAREKFSPGNLPSLKLFYYLIIKIIKIRFD